MTFLPDAVTAKPRTQLRIAAVVVSIGLTFSGCATPQAATIESPANLASPQHRIGTRGLSSSLAPAAGFEAFGDAPGDRGFHSDIAFYETVLSYGPSANPRPLFLLTNAYNVTSQQQHGLRFLELLLERYEDRMTDDMRATHLSAYALLRATYAERVPLFRRVFWVLDTFETLKEAARLSPGSPLVHWSAGIIYAQVPWFFGKADEGKAELLWLVERPELEPNPGFYREAYRLLSKLYAEEGEGALAERYLRLSGYQEYEPHELFMGWFVTTKEKGLRFAPYPRIEEVIPNRVYSIQGFGFSDLHFIVSDDRAELISIDAGTQPYSMKAGYEYFAQRYPHLPPLTTVFVTHAHWDHVGGSSYLASLSPRPTFYGRGNYAGTVERALRHHSYKQFRGEGFRDEWVRGYRPDVETDELTEVTVGGTTFELVPVTGGETEDALLIHASGLGVVFAGDALMPFYGEPWVEEGFPEEAIDMMDEILRRKPERILHGHVGIGVLYGDLQQLRVYRDAYAWLLHGVRKHLENGYSAKDIIRLNLIPPGLEREPRAFFGYLSPRDHLIARVADHMTGIWQEDATGKEPGGFDVLTSTEYGRLLELYLGLSDVEVEGALLRMLDGGDNELALQLAVAAEARYADNAGIIQLKERAADRLRSSVQYFDPFKFTTYTEMIGKEHREIPATAAARD